MEGLTHGTAYFVYDLKVFIFGVEELFLWVYDYRFSFKFKIFLRLLEVVVLEVNDGYGFLIDELRIYTNFFMHD